MMTFARVLTRDIIGQRKTFMSAIARFGHVC